MEFEQQVIVRDVRTHSSKVIDVTPESTIQSIIEEYSSERNISLVYQNSILDSNRTIQYYNLPNQAILYAYQIERRRNLANILPEFAEMSQTGDLLIPLIENLVHNNQEVELTDSSNPNNPVFRIELRRQVNGRPQQTTVRIGRTTIPLQQRTTTNTTNSTNTPNANTNAPNANVNTIHRTTNIHVRQDVTMRRQVENQLNSHMFDAIISRAQNNPMQPQYDVDYNAAMLFTQNWLNALSGDIGRVLVVINSVTTLLNNPRIALSQQSFNNVSTLLRNLSGYLAETADLMENNYRNFNNRTARRQVCDIVKV